MADWAMSARSKSGLSVEFRIICLSMALRGITGCVSRLEDVKVERVYTVASLAVLSNARIQINK